MDTWKYYDITHRGRVLCNPLSVARLDAVLGMLDLPLSASVLDLACGMGELLVRLAETYGARPGADLHGTGVDISPYCIAEARARAAARVPAAALEFVELDAAAYRATPAGFDLACCVGGAFALGGYRQTLTALRAASKPGGLVLVGEAFWRSTPAAEYLDWSGLARDQFASHAGNVELGVAAGLVPLAALASNTDEWDDYESHHWRATARYAAQQPADPDLPELVERVERGRHEYLRWGRDTVGWGLYLFGRS